MYRDSSFQIISDTYVDLPLTAPSLQVLKFPERFYPGAFNYFLNSHQIMHVCSAVGLVTAPQPHLPLCIFIPSTAQALMIRAGELDRTTGCFWNPALHV
jgi:hypothetical protein